MFKIGDRVLVDWNIFKKFTSEPEFRYFKNLLTAEIKRGDGSLEIFDIVGKQGEYHEAGLAGWSGSAILGLIWAPVKALIKANPPSLNVLNNYLYIILWSSVRGDGEALDAYYDIDDFAPEAIDQARKDLDKFLYQVAFLLDGLDLEQVVRDFWLTRNHHGSGFWDGDYEKVVADKLTKIAHSFKEQTAYIGDDDDLIYLE